jgi:hypothetical protein
MKGYGVLLWLEGDEGFVEEAGQWRCKRAPENRGLDVEHVMRYILYLTEYKAVFSLHSRLPIYFLMIINSDPPTPTISNSS